MKLQSTMLGLSLFAAILFSGAPAEAQRLEVSFGARGEHGSIGVGFSTGGAYGGSGYLGAPSYHYDDCAPGYYRTVYRKFWVEGRCRREWVPPVYEYREYCDDFGRFRRESVVVSHGYWREVQEPGYYEKRAVRVWVPRHRGGRW